MSRIKDAWAKVEDLTAGTTMTADQVAALQDMRASLAKIDQASVEATGLRTFANKAAQIGTKTAQVEAYTADLSRGINLSEPAAIEAGVEQKLNTINQSARDIQVARTMEDQINAAVNKLATTVQDPQLQAYLARTQNGTKTLEALKGTTAELHEAVSYNALERSNIIATAESENSIAAARAVEARIQNDVALANSKAVQTAATDYRVATERFATAQDRTLAAAQIQQKYDTLQAQLNLAHSNSAISSSEEMVAAQRAQDALSQEVSDSQLM